MPTHPVGGMSACFSHGWVGLLAVTASLLLAGCARDLSSPLDIDTCRAGMVLAELEGQEITVRDFRARRSLETALVAYRKRDLSAQKTAGALAKFTEGRNRRILAELVNQALVKSYLEKRLAGQDASRLRIAAEARMEKDVGDALRKFSFKTLEQAATELGVDSGYLQDQLAVPTRVALARESFAGKPFTVTEKEIDEGLERMQRYHDRAVASNAVTRATASNVLERVKAGGDFAALGRQNAGFSPEEAQEWGDFEAEEIEDAALRKWAFTAPVGSVGGPFDVEDGLCVVKILNRTNGSPTPSLAAEETASVSLARIAFYMWEEDPEPRTRAYVRETLGEWKANEAQKALFASLHAGMRLTYPNGTNFVFSTSEKPSHYLNKEIGK